MTEQSPTPPSAWISHVLPFVAWIFFMQVLGDPSGWKYAVRSGVCLIVFLALKPWKWSYPPFQGKNLVSATLVGIFVFLFWVVPETDFAARFEGFHRGYLTVGTQMPWSLSSPLVQVRYAPDTDGWFFALTRLAGSALVISFIEEFFWRGWMTRWVEKENFLEVDPGEVSTKSILIASLMFASIHNRWIAGLLCGLVYGFYYRKTRDIWAVGYAHALTNGLLGAYVLWSDKFEFWA
ncbi:MAG: CAAX prenyl protease-related protein [Kiritimatiellae bacterium]|jgi:CAAX prenyl protease-like protein|nr:CAAX prenyl protease-related protein [Kiritimatiellia bacterium]